MPGDSPPTHLRPFYQRYFAEVNQRFNRDIKIRFEPRCRHISRVLVSTVPGAAPDECEGRCQPRPLRPPTRPRPQPPLPPLPLPVLDGSPVQSVGCGWSGGPRLCRLSSLVDTPRDQYHLQTKRLKVPSTQFQKSRNLR